LTAPATPLSTRNRFTPNFQGWGLDENLKPKSPPYPGAHKDVRWQDKNEVGLAARAAMLRVRSGASILHCDHGALRPLLPLRLYKKSVFYRQSSFSQLNSALPAQKQQANRTAQTARKAPEKFAT